MKSFSNLKYIIYLVFVFFLLNTINANTYINEINFIGNEFIEIYSDTFLNLTNNKIYDDNGVSKFNTLSLNNVKNSSNYYLIVGSNFANSNNLSNLNCTIYKTDKSQISNGGLKSSGENFTIELNSSSNLSWTKDKTYSFQVNETLNYNYSSNKFSVSNSSICLSNIFPLVSNLNSTNSSNSTSNNSSINLTSNCNYKFDIVTNNNNNNNNNIFENKIKYSFDTNTTNFEIDYWIEDYKNNIVKSLRTTTNLNQKSYTPKDYNEIYIINAKLKKDSCEIKNSKNIFFYSNSKIQQKIVKTSTNKKSKIEILNEKDLLNSKFTKLKYEIYRGDTNKRTAYIYLNSKIIHTIELDKFSSVKGKIDLINILPGENKIFIKGLDTEKELIFFKISKSKSLELTKKLLKKSSKQYFRIQNFIVNSSNISFKIDSNINNLTSDCYVNYIKTRISISQNITNKDKKRIKINNSKLLEKSNNLTNELKLTCKYKKFYLKSYKYSHLEFNYTIINDKNSSQINSNNLEKNSYYNNKDNKIFENYSYEDKILSSINSKKLSENPFLKKEKLKDLTKNETNFESKNQKSKTNSIYFLMIGLVLLSSTMIIKW